jgi:hypothetical protein
MVVHCAVLDTYMDNCSGRLCPKAIQQKLDRLDEAFLFAQSIDIDTYDRHKDKDKMRQELTLLEIDGHSGTSKNSTWKAFWHSQSASCLTPRTCGCRRRSNSGSAFSSCSFLMEWCSTEIALFEPR